MALLVNQIKTPLGQTEEEILEAGRLIAKLQPQEISGGYVVKTSVDARNRDRIHLVSSVSFDVKGKEAEVQKRTANSPQAQFIKCKIIEPLVFSTGTKKMNSPPIIVGFGPAGMFAGLALARMGYNPIILERGADVDARVKIVERFWQENVLDTQTNVQFGEGGAGTFSDGKLTTRINDSRCDFLLEEMVRYGAPKEILHKQRPHVGTDLLRDVVKNIRQEILRLGGNVLFNTKMEKPIIRNRKVVGVVTNKGEMQAETVILALGHSARDTFSQLMEAGMFLEAKAFSVGLRIEQRQEVIDQGLYGIHAGNPTLPKGEYQLSWRNKEGRGVYTFCMCPGGVVVPSSSEENSVVTNGMSVFARDDINANSAIVVGVDSKDFGKEPLDGMNYQRMLESRAFVAGGGNYSAPAQSVKSFLGNTKPDLLSAKTVPSFSSGVKEAPLTELFPDFISQMLKTGLRIFEGSLKGFANEDAVLTGIETRTSSPVRIIRNPDNLQAASLEGLYPCGEGAGYAGGIMSAAVDGIRVAEQVMFIYKP